MEDKTDLEIFEEFIRRVKDHHVQIDCKRFGPGEDDYDSIWYEWKTFNRRLTISFFYDGSLDDIFEDVVC